MRVDVIAGRFALCDPFAGGSTGTVWRAWDLKQRRYCAAKVLRQRDSGDLIRFTREQAVRLAHRHVLTPYSWVAEDEHVLIASDLVQGGSVSTLIGDWGPLSAATVADVTAQLLDGLAHVHETGLTHRDVKPGNVLLDLTPRADRARRAAPAEREAAESETGGTPFTVRLADFGLAVRSDDARLTQHGLVIGTPGYLSPEALAGDVPAPAQDLYAAGRLALALLTGHEPADLGEPMDLRALPAAGTLAMVVRALLADDPAQRPAAVTARDVLWSAPAAASGATTAFGDPVTLVDQLPPWPDGWSDSGPDPSLLEPGHQNRPDLGAITSAVPVQIRVTPDRPPAAAPGGPATGTPDDAASPAGTSGGATDPWASGATALGASSDVAASGPTSESMQASAGSPDPAPAPERTPAVAASMSPQAWSAPPPASGAQPVLERPAVHPPSAPVRTSARPPTGRPRWRSPVFIVAAAAVIVWLAALGYLISDVVSKVSNGDSSSSSSSSSAPPGSRVSSTPTTSAASRTTAITAAKQTTPPPPALNGTCAFAQEGNEVTVGSTTLRCVRSGSAFSWKKV